MVCRGGRADRTGRYGNTHNDHNFRDMDYRGYSQEEEEAGGGYDGRPEGDPFSLEEQAQGVLDFSPGYIPDRPGFHQRGGGRGRGDMGREGKGLLWPSCPQTLPDLALPLPLLQRDEDAGPRREFEQLRTGLQERGRGKGGRGFLDGSGHLGGRDSSWGHGAAHCEQMDYAMGNQREEERFPRGTAKKRVRHRDSGLTDCAGVDLLLSVKLTPTVNLESSINLNMHIFI